MKGKIRCIKKVVNEVLGEFGVKKIILFGSRAKGNYDKIAIGTYSSSRKEKLTFLPNKNHFKNL